MSAPVLGFFAPGQPQPKGSWRAFVRGGRARFVADNRALAHWARDVELSARHAAASTTHEFPWDCPVELELQFYLARPPSRKKAPHADTKPDLDKLERAVGDALVKAGVLREDSRIVRKASEKVYAGSDDRVGALIVMRKL